MDLCLALADRSRNRPDFMDAEDGESYQEHTRQLAPQRFRL